MGFVTSTTRAWKRLSRLQQLLVIILSLVSLSIYLLVLSNKDESRYPPPAQGLVDNNPLVEKAKQELLDSKVDETNEFEDDKPVKNTGPIDHIDEVVISPSSLFIPDLFILNKPYESYEISTANPDKKVTKYQLAVKNATKYAFEAYIKGAWGFDELAPLQRTSKTWFGLGLTIIDSLDTLLMMNLDDLHLKGKDWVQNGLDIKSNNNFVSFFEVTIRIFGGLLSAYYITKDELYLKKSIEIGDALLPAFNSETGVPFSDVNLHTGKTKQPSWSSDSSLAEFTTVQLEFCALSDLTKDAKYCQAAMKVSKIIHNAENKKDGLVPIFVNPRTLQIRGPITFGARGDSYYEYLLKRWQHSGKNIDWLLNDFHEAMGGVFKHLVQKTPNQGLTYIGELLGGQTFSPKMDHLACFLSGNLALAHHLKQDPDQRYLQLAKDLGETCYKMYSSTQLKLAPEIVFFRQAENFREDMFVKPQDSHYLLRPETVEAFFYLYRVTKDDKYRTYGWEIFRAIERVAKLPDNKGYCSIDSVNSQTPTYRKNKMESFFIAETLKYLYLLFSDDDSFYSLDEWVFNTEAHPLPILPDGDTTM